MEEAYAALIKLYEDNSYLCFDDLIDITSLYGLSISQVDTITDRLLKNGIFILDEKPLLGTDDKEENQDFSVIDYNALYDRCIELAPEMTEFINSVRSIRPPQFRETSSLKHLLAEGNKVARQRMIEMHIRIAVKIALQRAEKYDLDLEDTIGDAMVGLILGVDKYDPHENGAFSSYISYWIIQNISREQGVPNYLVYCPVHVKDKIIAIYPELKNKGCTDCDEIYKCDKARNLIKKQLGEQININNLEEIIMLLQKPIELEEAEEMYADIICTEESLEDICTERLFRNEISSLLLGELKEKQRIVIEERYGFVDGIPKTLEEVGSLLCVTRERVRQIESNVLRRFKNKPEIKKLTNLV
ncbi:MAG: sigma-70 family RNA polymerase sigma factor [Lachnospiraceae bacterium]|nr:sigma-70 family RNA polymerase sigma factor [Lachnospiraceae bacterium]